MKPRRTHFLLILPAGVSLLAALWAGLSRLGWDVPLPTWSLPSYHGPLMVVGFIGTLIGLERAVAVRRRWAYMAPLLLGLGAVAMLVELPWEPAHGMMTGGGLVLVCIFAVFYHRQPSIFIATMGAGALLLVAGNLLWRHGQPLYESDVIPWWTGFLVLTIAGERLELSRLMGVRPWSRVTFLTACGILLSGLGVSLLHRETGIRLAGMGLAGVALWLLRYDLAWKTVRLAGLSRYIALSLIIGYCWLAVGGVLWLLLAHLFLPGPQYDAMLHSIFLGFVFSMILGHAPIILPSVLGIALPFRRAFYAPLALLHLSLLLRVGGDLTGWIPAQRWGGVFNVLAFLLFLAGNVRAGVNELRIKN